MPSVPSNKFVKTQNADGSVSNIQTFGTTVANTSIDAPASVQTDGLGRIVAPQSKMTYSAVCGGLAGFTPAATPTDIFVLSGSNTKTVRLVDLIFCGTATAAALVDVHLLRRSQQNTGGTYVPATIVKNDMNDDVSSVGLCGHYTANPTSLGPLVGSMLRRKVLLPISATVVDNADKTLLSSMSQSILDKPYTLRGINDVLAINFNGAALPAGAAGWYVVAVWTEEPEVA